MFSGGQVGVGAGPLRTSVVDGVAPAHAAGLLGAVVSGAAAAEV